MAVFRASEMTATITVMVTCRMLRRMEMNVTETAINT